MDASVEVKTALPWIGCTGNRTRDRRLRWTQNGHDLLEMMRCNQLVAISTWKSQSPVLDLAFGVWDSSRFIDADHGIVKVHYRMPVGLSGFRDDRPLFARVCTRPLETCGGQA